MIQHHLRLRSDQHYGKRVPPEACGDVLRAVPAVARRAVAMRLSGRSTPSGRRTNWLRATSDIRFVDFYGDDDTVLVFEAPGLGEAAEELFRQPDMFTSHPAPEDTGLDLLADVWEEVRRRNAESDLFDKALLSKMAVFRHGLDGVFQSAELWGNRIPSERPARLDHEVIAAARELAASTPRSQRVRISGTLDMIRASTLGFGLKLDDGQEVRGVLQEGDAQTLQEHFQRRIVVLGRAIFRPSRHLLRIDADEIAAAGNGDRFFSTLPEAAPQRFAVREVVRAQQHKKGLQAIIGAWPGEETDDEIEEALGRVS